MHRFPSKFVALLAALLLVLSGCMPAAAGLPGWSGGAAGGGGAAATVTHDTFATINAISCTEGDSAQATDGPQYEFKCFADGTWTIYFRGVEVTPPPSTGWTWYNQGGSSVATVGGAEVITAPAEAFTASRFRGRYRAQPSDPTVTPYFVEVGAVVPLLANTTAKESAIVAFSDETGLAYVAQSSGRLHFTRNSNATTFAAQDFVDNTLGLTHFAMIRLEEDATNRHAKIMGGAGEWVELGGGFTRTDTFTATGMVVGPVSLGTTLAPAVTIVHYAEGAL